MRFASLIHTSALVLLLCGCPGAEENGSGSGKPGIEGSGAGSNQGGTGQGGTGQGGAGQGGSGQGGAGQGSAGQGGAGSGQGGAGSGQGSAGQGGAGAGQGGAGQGGAGGGNSALCEEIENDIQVKLVEAQKCKLGIDSVQCGESVSGLCCSVIVNHKDAPEVLAYLEALEKYKSEKCAAACPAIPCPAEVKGECLPESPNAGKCAQSP
jgi:hypothetical protein